MNVALRGSVLAAVEAAKYMREHGGGRIVLISSINAPASEPESAHYSAAKAAIVSVAKSIAVDLAGTGVVANAVAPGWVYTDMVAEFVDNSTPEQMKRVNPLGRAGRVDELAGLVLYLIRDARHPIRSFEKMDRLTRSCSTRSGSSTIFASRPR